MHFTIAIRTIRHTASVVPYVIYFIDNDSAKFGSFILFRRYYGYSSTSNLHTFSRLHRCSVECNLQARSIGTLQALRGPSCPIRGGPGSVYSRLPRVQQKQARINSACKNLKIDTTHARALRSHAVDRQCYNAYY